MKDFKNINNPIEGVNVATAFMSNANADKAVEKKARMVSLRVKPSVWDEVERMAKADSRTKSQIVELAILEYAKSH